MQTSSASTPPPPPPPHDPVDEAIAGRAKLQTLSTDDLVEAYTRTVGRPTKSTDRAYLIWKIREVRNGRIRPGPSDRKGKAEGEAMIIPLKMGRTLAAELDAHWRAHGYRSRMHFIRMALATQVGLEGGADLARALRLDA